MHSTSTVGKMRELAALSLERLTTPTPSKRLRAFGAFLLASLWPDFWGSTARAAAAAGNKPVGKTAYLDGLRGFAALMIYAQHNTDYAHQADQEKIHHAFGWNGEYYFTTAPFIKIFFHTGNLAVMFFFAISGYVSAVSLLKLLHAHDTNKIGTRLGAGIPGRFVRLWGPAMGISFTFMLSWHIFGITPDGTHYPPASSLSVEIPRWFGNFFNKSYLYSASARLPNDLYDPHLWYIPLQFQASILLTLIILCFAGYHKYPPSVRIWSMIAVTIYFGYFVDAYFCALTTFGMLMCDIDLLSQSGQLPAPFNRKVPNWIWYIPFLLGIWVSTIPSGTSIREIRQEDPGWYYLTYLKPAVASNAAHWFSSWSGVLLLLAIPRINWLRKFFELPILRDFGKITFSFYLVQGPLLWTVGERIYAAFGRGRFRSADTAPGWVNLCPLPAWGPLGLELNFIAANLILLPLMVWIASIAVKVYEVPCGKFATWAFNPDRYEYQALPTRQPPAERAAPAERESLLAAQEAAPQPMAELQPPMRERPEPPVTSLV